MEKAQTSADMVAQARDFRKNRLAPLARELDRDSRFPEELVAEMAERGFFGIHYPPEYGGRGLDCQTAYRVVEELSLASPGVALTFHVHWMAADVLFRFGSADQKRRFLPVLTRGGKIAAFSISEAQAGSDAAAISAVATEATGGWSLNGAKWFCTNGGLADVYLVAAKTEPAAGAKGISMFIVEKGATGFTIGDPEEKMGCRSSVTTGLTFRDCFVPGDNLLGKVNDGFKAAMYGLIGGRLGMAAMGLGIAEAALTAAAGYANRRYAFGKPLAALYSVQEMLADMAVSLAAARLLVYDTAQKRDGGRDIALETSVAKLFVASTVNEICHKALQVFGGHGYMKYNDLERYARDARLLEIGVGATEVLKMVVGSAVARTKGFEEA